MEEQALINLIHAAVGASGGGGFILLVGKFLFQRALKAFEDHTKSMEDIRNDISAIAAKLPLLDQHHTVISKLQESSQAQEKKIVVLETRLNSGFGKSKTVIA